MSLKILCVFRRPFGLNTCTLLRLGGDQCVRNSLCSNHTSVNVTQPIKKVTINRESKRTNTGDEDREQVINKDSRVYKG